MGQGIGRALAAATWLAAAGLSPVAAQPSAPGPGRSNSAEWRSVDAETLRRILLEVARRGPVEDVAGGANRKLQINYAVNHPGVRLSQGLRRQYPDTITIVLQYRFARLSVSQRDFSVDLWFKGRRERVTVPFAAVRYIQDTLVDHEADI